jgi:integrase
MPRQSKPWFRKDRQAWFVTIDGHRQNLGPDRRRAMQKFHSLLAEPQRRKVQTDLVAAVVDAFLDWCHKHRSPATYVWYQAQLQLFVARYPDLTVAELRPFHVQQWIDSYPKLSSGTKHNYCRAIVRAMHWAEEQGLIDRSPLAHFKKPRAGQRETVISPEEYQRILSCVPNENFRDLLVFAWETGARAAECLAVEKRHVDLANARIVFPASEEKMRRAPRVIYLSEGAMAIVRRLMLQSHNHLFVNAYGIPWTTEAVNCAFLQVQIRMGKQAMREKGMKITPTDVEALMPKLRPHRISKGRTVAKRRAELVKEARRKLRNRMACQLAPKYCLTAFRHSWCHHALRRGLDALTVSMLMGHADPSMVSRVYSHLSHAPDFLRQAAQKAVG